MSKLILLPRLAFTGIKKNGATYFPYILAGIFSVFLFFVFSSILFNDLMKNMPHSAYLMVLMGIGLVLLGIILIPFMLYTNSFLIKRRKMELGLYSILGLEKKHIAIMMFFETLFIFCMVFAGGIILGVVFSKLLFLVLLNLASLPVSTEFALSFKALKITALFFIGVNTLNLIVNLIQVFRSNPNDLMKGARSGEKAPKRLWISALLGVLLLGAGYFIAIRTKLDANIFLNFFLAVLLVILGTHYFFKAGIIAVLRILKGNKKFYYYKLNYTTISGMLYRMKKSAASLANICIFSTMTIITLLCTMSLWFGTDSVLKFQYPFDIQANFKITDSNSIKLLETKLSELSGKTKVNTKDKIAYNYVKASVCKDGDKFIKLKGNEMPYNRDAIKLVTLKSYNVIEGKNEKLQDKEVLVYSSGQDFGFENVVLGQEKYSVKKELQEVVFEPKAAANRFGQDFYLIVKDENAVNNILNETGNSGKTWVYSVQFNLTGEEKDKKEFSNLLVKWINNQKELISFSNGIAGREETVSMYGGLLFLGIFFGIVFSMCLVLIMYYKQITEGYDDRDNFSIMQKVGMSDLEVRGTIKRQILLVFFLPLLFAVLHTMAGFGIISELLNTLFLFNRTLIIITAVIVSSIFAVLYGLSYILTSKIYYKLVSQMN